MKGYGERERWTLTRAFVEGWWCGERPGGGREETDQERERNNNYNNNKS